MNSYCEQVLHQLKQKDASQPEFLQAVEEVLTSVSLIFDHHPEYENGNSGTLDRTGADYPV